MPLFDPAALARIEAAVREGERGTAGEIVVVSVPSSDDYHDVRLAYGVALALSAAAVVHALAPALEFWWLLWLQAAMVVLGWLALGVPPLLRLLVPKSRRQSSVLRRAQLEFMENRVYETRDRTGVLILLSELEHKVIMLGDSGIYTQLKHDGFQAYVDRIIAAIRAGRAADGVCEVIADLGQHLSARFPARQDDTNELPDSVRQEDR
jgi:putative membrane protein